MSVPLLYLIFVRLCRWLVLLGRSSVSTDAGLPVRRHVVAVLRRTHPRPRLDWADRAVPAALVRLRPARLRMHRLVNPAPSCGGTAASSPASGTCHWTGRPPVSAGITGLTGRLAAGNDGWDTSGSRASCSSPATGSAHLPSAGSSKP